MNGSSNVTRAIIYCRVSSEEQAAQDKTSLGNQEAECRRVCEARGYEVVAIYKDTGPGNMQNRLQLDQVSAKVAAGEADVVMATTLDRLFGASEHFSLLMEDIERSGARIEFALEDEGSATDRLIQSIRSFMAEAEREYQPSRVRQGIQQKIFRRGERRAR